MNKPIKVVKKTTLVTTYVYQNNEYDSIEGVEHAVLADKLNRELDLPRTCDVDEIVKFIKTYFTPITPLIELGE